MSKTPPYTPGQKVTYTFTNGALRQATVADETPRWMDHFSYWEIPLLVDDEHPYYPNGSILWASEDKINCKHADYKAISVDQLDNIETLLRGYQIALDNILYKNMGVTTGQEVEKKIDAALDSIESAGIIRHYDPTM